jgi:hypothetical protein
MEWVEYVITGAVAGGHDGSLCPHVDCPAEVAACQDTTGSVMGGESFAVNATLLPVILTWERCHQSPSALSGHTMNVPISGRRGCMAESVRAESDVAEIEGEGPGWRGVW